MSDICIKNSTPSYQLVYDTLLREAKKSGPEGILAPSYSVLAKKFNVSSSTIIRAIDLLKKDGWAYGRQGKGTYLCQRPVSSDISTIVFITPSLDADASLYTKAIAKKLNKSHYNLSICSTHGVIEQYQQLIEKAISIKPAGVILISVPEDLCLIDPSPLIKIGIPVVVIGYHAIPGLACDRVVYKQQDSSCDIAHYILRNDWHKIGIILSSRTGGERPEFLQYLRRDLQSGGVNVPDKQVFYWDMPHGFEDKPNPYIDTERQMDQLLADGFRCDALVLGHDYPAVGALRSILNAGIQVPKQMRVISGLRCAVDGATPMKLTTIDSNRQKQANIATELLIRRLDGYNGPIETHYVRGNFIEGETS